MNGIDNVYAFVIGNCDEWNEGRRIHGDVRLVQAFEKLVGGSRKRSNVVFLRDEECALANIHQKLKELLYTAAEETAKEDNNAFDATLFVYYGGHGEETYFPIGPGGEEKLFHRDLVQTIHQLFMGNKVWFVIDCCHAGNFVKALTSKMTFLAIMATDGNHLAGPEWTLTSVLVEAMENHPSFVSLQSSTCDDDDDTTKNENVGKKFSIASFLSHLSDRVAFEKRNRLNVSLLGSAIDVNDDFPFCIPSQSSWLTTNITCACIPRKAPTSETTTTTMLQEMYLEQRNWRRIYSLQQGMSVFVKWEGRGSMDNNDALLPGWYRATTTRIENNVCSAVKLLAAGGLELSSSDESAPLLLLEDSIFTFDRTTYLAAHCTLATYGRYIDYSVPRGTRVWWEMIPGAKGESKCLVSGLVVSDLEIPWYDIDAAMMEMECHQGKYGPFLPVQIKKEEEEESTIVLVAKQSCSFFEPAITGELEDTISPKKTPCQKLSPRQAMISSTIRTPGHNVASG